MAVFELNEREIPLLEINVKLDVTIVQMGIVVPGIAWGDYENIALQPSQSSRVVYSAVLTAQAVTGSSPKPPPILADMSSGMWIEKAWLPC